MLLHKGVSSLLKQRNIRRTLESTRQSLPQILCNRVSSSMRECARHFALSFFKFCQCVSVDRLVSARMPNIFLRRRNLLQKRLVSRFHFSVLESIK